MGDGQERLEAFTKGPREAGLLGVLLVWSITIVNFVPPPKSAGERCSHTVPRGHVDAHAPAFDGVEGVLGGEVVGLVADDGGKLDLVVQVDALGHEDGPGIGVQERTGGLEEEEGFFSGGVAELFDVGGVVAADAGDCAGGAEEGYLRGECVLVSGRGEGGRGRRERGGGSSYRRHKESTEY